MAVQGVWHGVHATVAPGVATQDAPTPQGRSSDCAVLLQGLKRVSRTRGLETTGVTEPGLEQKAVAADQAYEGLARERP